MYTKITKLPENKTTLSFIGCDFYHFNKLGFGNSFQRCEEKEHENKFEQVLYSVSSYSGNLVSYILMKFDFDNSIVEVNGKKMNIIRNYEFTFKKTTGNNILAIGGIDGFYKTVVNFLKTDSAFNSWFMGSIEKMFKTKSERYVPD